MDYYKIAGLTIALNNQPFDYVTERLNDYRISSCNADLAVDIVLCDAIINVNYDVVKEKGKLFYCRTIEGGYAVKEWDGVRVNSLLEADENITRATITLTNEESPTLSNDKKLFNMLGELFKYALVLHGGIVMHGSSISYKGMGLLFSAPSGTGKTTHTSLWREYYPNDTAIINDDTPAVIFKDGKLYLCGTPWSGTTELNNNVTAEHLATVFITRGTSNTLTELKGEEALLHMLIETRMLPYAELMKRYWEVFTQLAESKTYLLSCDMSKKAVDVVKRNIDEQIKV